MQLPKLRGLCCWAHLNTSPVLSGVNCVASSTHFKNIFKHVAKCLQSEGHLCLLLWGARTWQNAGNRSISNISRGVASLWILRKEINVSGLTSAYGHPALVTCLLWSVPLAYKIQSSGASFSRGHLSFFARFNFSLRGFTQYFVCPCSALSEVCFSHHKDLVMFSTLGDMKNITQAAILDLKSCYWHFLESFSLDR